MKKVSVKIISAVLALALSAVGLTGCGAKNEGVTSEVETANQTAAQISEVRNPYTGEKGYDESKLGLRPVAVMVENSPSARPQWGLCSPDIIFETEVEGGITRMMWLYANTDSIPDKVGPVRSTRNAYAELALGLDAILFHIGASDIAYRDYINSGIIDDIDGMAKNFYSRDKSRNVATEHTAYTTREKIIDAINEYTSDTTISDSYAEPFDFIDTGATASGVACSSIRAFFSDNYVHTFKYDADDGLYYNYMNSTAMTDEYGVQMAVKNVIVLFADMVDLGDEKGHVDVELSSGNGYYLSEGKVINVTWDKGSYDNMLTIYDENDVEISLNAGKTWIGFIRSSYSLSTTLGE